MEPITPRAEDLMRQAHMTSVEHLEKAIAHIDRAFNTPGYARAHSALVGTFMQVCALNYLAGSVTAGLQEIAEHSGNRGYTP